jgi:hypothetical protein
MSRKTKRDVVEVASHDLLSIGGKLNHAMDYGTFIATEGGRKCPMCGKYAKAGTVGNLSFTADIGCGWAHISMYGHLPGYGCNISDNAEPMRGQPMK